MAGSLVLCIRQGVSHLGTSMRSRAHQMEFEAIVSIFSDSDGEQANILCANKGSERAILLRLDHLHVGALLKSELLYRSSLS